MGVGLARASGGGYREPAHRFVAAMPKFVALVRDKFRVDELYGFLIIRPIRSISRGLYFVVDRVLIDQIMVHGVGGVVDVLGRISRIFQGGDVQRYLAVFALGVAGVFYVATRPPAPSELSVKVVEGTMVEANAGQGMPTDRPMDYDFDFDEDGTPNRMGKNPIATFAYEGRGTYTVKVTITDPRWGTTRTLTQKVTVK